MNTDAKLVELLTAIRTTVDPAKRQDAAVAAQKYLIDQAYEVPIYVDTRYVAISAKIKGVILAKVGEPLYGWYLNDAYIP